MDEIPLFHRRRWVKSFDNPEDAAAYVRTILKDVKSRGLGQEDGVTPEDEGLSGGNFMAVLDIDGTVIDGKDYDLRADGAVFANLAKAECDKVHYVTARDEGFRDVTLLHLKNHQRVLPLASKKNLHMRPSGHRVTGEQKYHTRVSLCGKGGAKEVKRQIALNVGDQLSDILSPKGFRDLARDLNITKDEEPSSSLLSLYTILKRSLPPQAYLVFHGYDATTLIGVKFPEGKLGPSPQRAIEVEMEERTDLASRTWRVTRRASLTETPVPKGDHASPSSKARQERSSTPTLGKAPASMTSPVMS